METALEVLPAGGRGRRNRKWPDEVKARVVAETLKPGFSCSGTVRAVKPEPAFFDALQTRTEFPAHEILMVGDNLTSDIDEAKSAGMAALHYVPGVGAPGPGKISRLTDVLYVLGLK